MEVAPQIDFQGTEPSEAVRGKILQQIGALERRFGRIVSCRVVVKVPGPHHRAGAPYEINVWLVLPGHKEVSVVRTPVQDERHANLDFALNDAFRRARRQLQDRIRRMQSKVKVHVEPPVARVSALPPEGGFGFLTAADGHEIYFHQNAVLDGKFAQLKVGSRVTFVEEAGIKGPQASTVRLVEPRRSHEAPADRSE